MKNTDTLKKTVSLALIAALLFSIFTFGTIAANADGEDEVGKISFYEFYDDECSMKYKIDNGAKTVADFEESISVVNASKITFWLSPEEDYKFDDSDQFSLNLYTEEFDWKNGFHNLTSAERSNLLGSKGYTITIADLMSDYNKSTGGNSKIEETAIEFEHKGGDSNNDENESGTFALSGLENVDELSFKYKLDNKGFVTADADDKISLGNAEKITLIMAMPSGYNLTEEIQVNVNTKEKGWTDGFTKLTDEQASKLFGDGLTLDLKSLIADYNNKEKTNAKVSDSIIELEIRIDSDTPETEPEDNESEPLDNETDPDDEDETEPDTAVTDFATQPTSEPIETTAPTTEPSTEKKDVKTSKKSNTLVVKTAKKTIKAKKLKKGKKTVKPLTVKNAKGALKIVKVKKGTTAKIYKKIKVNNKTGAITFKKGKYAKKVYKIKLKITAKGNKSYKSKTITKIVKVKIK